MSTSVTTASTRVAGVALRTAGDGEPVLLLHGIGGSSASFAPQLDGPLAGRYRLLAWDAPGYGGSADPPSGMDGEAALDHLADTAAAVIDACGGYAAVVGVSWGGVIATRLALRHPGAVRALVLADSSRGSGRTPAGRAGMRRRGQELAAVGAETFAALRGPRLVAPGADRAVADRIVSIMSGIRPAGHAFAAASMAGADHSRTLADVAAPTLVVVGQHDQVTGVPESLALAEGIPGARFALVCGAGHAANQERPDRFDALVGRFLAGVGQGVEQGVSR